RFTMPYARIGAPHTGSMGFGRSEPSVPSRVLIPAQSTIARIVHNVARAGAVPQWPVPARPGVTVSVGEPVCYGRRVRVGPLDRCSLPEAMAVLAAGCAFDRAAEVADEKLFGAAPTGSPQALGAWDGDALVG